MKKPVVILVMMALAAAVSGVAQEVEVKDFAADAFDLTAQKYAPNDLNGRKCALVKVQVLSPGVVFSGNVIGTPERHSSEYWVYMTHGTKMLKLASESFLPLMFSFPEPLQSGMTYLLTLALPAANTGANPTAADIDLTEQYVRFQDDDTEKYGYYGPDGDIAIPARFEMAEQFLDGLARVMIGDKYGLIDKTGTAVIPAIYDDISYGYSGNFKGGIISVCLNDKWGFIDRAGNMVIPAKYDALHDFVEGMAAAQVGDKWGFIDASGKMVIPARFDEVFQFEDDYCVVRNEFSYGFIDKSGKVVVPIEYNDVGVIREGYCSVCVDDKWGYVDTTGKMTVQPVYDETLFFSEGLAPVRVGEKWGYIDTAGKLVIPAKYDSANTFYGGITWVTLDGNEIHLDRTGKEVNVEELPIVDETK